MQACFGLLPGMDGLQCLRAVRADPGLGATPCLAVSAHAMPQAIETAPGAGFDGDLSKPLSAGALVRALADALQRTPPQA